MAIWVLPLEVTQNEDSPFILGFANADPSGQLSLAVPYVFAATTVEVTATYTSSVPYNTSNPTVNAGTLLFSLSSASSSVYVNGGSISSNPWGALTFGTATIQGAPVATINFTVPKSVTVNFLVGTYYFDILWKNGSTNKYLANGPFSVQPSVSR